MKNHLKNHCILSILLVIAILLPVGSMFLFLFARLLYQFGDLISGWILDGAAVALATLWIIDFVALVFGVTIRMILVEEQKMSKDV